MPSPALPILLAAALLAAVPPASAAPGPCQIAVEEADPLADRVELLAEYERLPQHCLKAIFHECTSAAGSTLMDFASAAMCSLSYEALLKQGFGGSFQALLAWWRAERVAPSAR